jgi:hypothetical protein
VVEGMTIRIGRMRIHKYIDRAVSSGNYAEDLDDRYEIRTDVYT